ncbi:MAG TPA: hypothetical protein VHZ33_17730 [Trebonia sp.]|jgi:hypothetical protein|nr:hypothetical protein [Trebonia sp.]
MPKGIMLVQSGPSDPAREDEYNDWYASVHIPQILGLPGFTGARRYRALNPANADAPPYLAIYDLEADDLNDPIKELRARSRSGEIDRSDALQLDPPPVTAVYRLLD